jgi:hypothetical protein
MWILTSMKNKQQVFFSFTGCFAKENITNSFTVTLIVYEFTEMIEKNVSVTYDHLTYCEMRKIIMRRDRTQRIGMKKIKKYFSFTHKCNFLSQSFFRNNNEILNIIIFW